MKWIGLTGGIATGKSTVAEMLRKKGFTVIDADQITHSLMRPGTKAYDQIVRVFGRGLVLPDQSLDRRALGAVVFQDRAKLTALEQILHPHVRASVRSEREKLENAGATIAFYDVPLLFEKDMESDFDATVCVASPVNLQRARMQSRNKWTDAEIEGRLQAQLPLSEKRKRATFVIENDGSLDELSSKLEKVLQMLQKG